MGGQHGYFGLWIDSDYGKGHSKAKPRCTTYNSPQLSAKEDFTLDAMEVWAVGDTPESAGVGETVNWACEIVLGQKLWMQNSQLQFSVSALSLRCSE